MLQHFEKTNTKTLVLRTANDPNILHECFSLNKKNPRIFGIINEILPVNRVLGVRKYEAKVAVLSCNMMCIK